jgi:hypothetical protein
MLAAIDHCSQPTMTNRVRRFEEADLVTRTFDPRDARAVRVRITAKGIRAPNAIRADRAAAIGPQLASLEPADRQVLATRSRYSGAFSRIPRPHHAATHFDHRNLSLADRQDHRKTSSRHPAGVWRVSLGRNRCGESSHRSALIAVLCS